jgi:hypothetical protein
MNCEHCAACRAWRIGHADASLQHVLSHCLCTSSRIAAACPLALLMHCEHRIFMTIASFMGLKISDLAMMLPHP